MKTKYVFLVLTICAILIYSCAKDDSKDTGTLIFKGVKPFSMQKSAKTNFITSSPDGSNTHVMHTANFKGFVTELWVSQGLVEDGISDDFEWYKIGTSNELKFIEDYLFSADKLPAGDYRSIKMLLKNTIIRNAVYQSNINMTVEMQGSISEDSCGDETILTEYFSKKGSHILDNGKFNLMSEGEHVRGFKIKPGEITNVFWRLGGPDSRITDCTFDWVDVNGNNIWDCGLDSIKNFNCIVDAPMFSFSVDDGEEEPIEEAPTPVVTDIDGNTYNSVKIGNQIWMQVNLKTTRLNDGTYLMTREEYQQYLIDNPPAPPPTPMPPSPPLRAIQNNDANLMNIYGCLYSWTAVQTGKLCPSGWHVPSDEEWTTMTMYLGENAGGKLKSSNLWHSPNEGATNETEFTALPGGAMVLQTWTGPNGEISSAYRYNGYGQYGYWLTSTQGWARILTYTSSDVSREYFHPTGARGDESFLSCRCIKD